MKYESTARPILTMEDWEAAQAVGALFQFTSCGPGSDWPVGDTYDMPRSGIGSGGWIIANDLQDFIKSEARDRGELVRAWYPLADESETAE